MEKKFNIVVGEDGTVKLPDAVLEKLEVKPGEKVRFEVDDNSYPFCRDREDAASHEPTWWF